MLEQNENFNKQKYLKKKQTKTLKLNTINKLKNSLEVFKGT